MLRRGAHMPDVLSRLIYAQEDQKISVRGREGKTPGPSNFMDIHFRKLSLSDDSKVRQKSIHETKI